MTSPDNLTKPLTPTERAEAEASFQKLLEEARSGTPIPDDLVAHAKMGRVPMEKNMRVAAQNQLPPPPGWLAHRRRLAEEEYDELDEENDAGQKAP